MIEERMDMTEGGVETNMMEEDDEKNMTEEGGEMIVKGGDEMIMIEGDEHVWRLWIWW